MWNLLVLTAMMAGAQAYIQLAPVSYIRLQDRAGGLTLNSSTNNQLCWDDGTNLLYTIAKEPGKLTTFLVNTDGSLASQTTINLQPIINGEPQAIEFCRPNQPGSTARVAIAFDDPTDPSQPGTIRLYAPLTAGSTNLQFITDFSAGSNPVDMVFAQDCTRLVVVNAGRPFRQQSAVNDPPGTVQVASLPAVLTSDSVISVDEIVLCSFLEDPDGSDASTVPDLVARGFRRGPIRDNQGNIIPISRNCEPVKVTLAPNGLTGYVASPVNNVIFRINLDLNIVADVFPYSKTNWTNSYMDASKADNAVHMENYRIFSSPQPGHIKWVTQGGSQFLITLDSGLLNEIPEYNNYKDYEVGSVLLAENRFGPKVDASLRAKLNDNTRLGQALISTVDGLDETGQLIEDIHMFGSRGFTIHDGQSMQILTAMYDSLERTSAQFYKEVHNTAFTNPSNTPQQDRDATSPSYGPNLRVMETGFFGDNKLLFLASRTSGMIYVYVLIPGANCPQPYFHSVHRRGGTSSSWQTLYNNNNVGDLGITDMLYIGDSMDHDNLLVVASATSNSVSVFRVTDLPVDLRK